MLSIECIGLSLCWDCVRGFCTVSAGVLPSVRFPSWFTVSLARCGARCTYFFVIFTVECPSTSFTSMSGTPLLIIQLAHVWRKSYIRKFVMRALVHALLNPSRRFPSRSPSAFANTHSFSFFVWECRSYHLSGVRRGFLFSYLQPIT